MIDFLLVLIWIAASVKALQFFIDGAIAQFILYQAIKDERVESLSGTHIPVFYGIVLSLLWLAGAAGTSCSNLLYGKNILRK